MEQHTEEQTPRVAPGTELIYLASPYSHENFVIVNARYRDTQDFVARHLAAGRFIYSPIVYAHPLAVRHNLPTSAEWWWAFNKTMIDHCDMIWVLCLRDWENSRGVRDEIDYAEIIGKLVKYWPSE